MPTAGPRSLNRSSTPDGRRDADEGIDQPIGIDELPHGRSGGLVPSSRPREMSALSRSPSPEVRVPAASPPTADPAGCQIEARPLSFFEDAVRQAVASPPPVPAFPPEGGGTVSPPPPAISEEGSRPAHAATVAAVEGTMREFAACINAGDLLRVFSLSTEQATRDNPAFLLSRGVVLAREEGTPAAALEANILRADGASFAASPVPVPEAERVPAIDVRNVRVPRDGRAVADIGPVPSVGADQARGVFAEEGGGG